MVREQVRAAWPGSESRGAGAVEARVRSCLERVSVSRVFDLEGLWEVLGELEMASGTPPEGRAEVGCLFVLVLRGRKNLGLSLERSLLADILADRVLRDKDIGCCAMLSYAMPSDYATEEMVGSAGDEGEREQEEWMVERT